MIWILTSYFLIIGIEIFRNWCIIDVGQRRPTYWWSNVIRVFVSFVFWVCVKPFSDITYLQWWLLIPVMLLMFWWVFDYGLIQFRNFMGRLQKRDPSLIWYRLNPKGSILDRLQCKALSLPAWFFIKLALMIASITLLYCL
ncbi:MAG TPA: hypothetical protein VGK59_10925 [Ohtaekwangia sp.]